MSRRWLVRGALLAALALAAFAGKLIVDAGAFRTIAPHFAGTTRAVPGLPGAEDVEYSPRNKVLFVSTDNRPEEAGEKTPDGALFAWMPDDPTRPPEKVGESYRPDHAFHPHGMAAWELADRTRLWVINHRENETSIEVFAYREGLLVHEKSLRDPLLATANDLIALDETRFYVTSDHGSAVHLAGRLEDYTRFGRGYVTYYDGKTFSAKATGIRYANGIALSAPASHPGSKLLVASMLGKAILIYDRDPATGDLKRTGEVALDGAPDNITCDQEGTVWVAAHPKMFALKAMNHDRRQRAPAMVLKITGITTATPRIEEVLMDDGSKIAAVSVAFKLGKRLILGSVFDDRLLDCTLP